MNLTLMRKSSFALVATTLGMIGYLWGAWCEFPFHPWNDVRLAPAFAVRHGINPYPLLEGGPLFTWIYGPVGILVNLPATWATTALGAIQTASVLNALTVLAPLAIVFFSSRELRSRGLATCALAFTLATLLVPRPNLVLHVADHSAIACGLLSCWCLARAPRPGAARLAAAAAFCALAIWSKQITVFLLLAQSAYLLLSGPRTIAVRYVAWVALFGLAGLAAFAVWFGFSNLWLNLVAIPARLPWTEFWPRFTLRPWSLFAQVLVPALLLLVMRANGRWPTRDSESGRFFQIAVLAAAAMLPVGLVAFFKIGGDTNLLHSSDYLRPAFLLAWLARDVAGTPAATFRMFAVVGLALAVRGKDLSSLPAQPFTRHFEAATQIAAAYPRALWFPQHPVLTFYADGRLWHSEDGILTRYAAGFGWREPDFRRHLPPNLLGVAYRAFVEFPSALPLLPEFNHPEKLPYWTLHTRAPQPPSQP